VTEFALSTPVPVAELDPFGELKAAAQIRLLQLAAAKASAAAGFDTAWYERSGTTWVVRSTRLRRLAPARGADELLIRTWVSDFRRVRSMRQYEVSRVGDGVVVADAATDWVYVDTASGAPAAVPAAVQTAFMPAGVVSEERPTRTRRRREEITTPLPLRRVELADLDSLGHVNNSHYASFVEQAVFDDLAAAGWTADLRTAAPHLRLTALQIEYSSPALLGQRLSARISRAAASERDIDASVEILADGRRAVAATARWQWSEGELPAVLRR
jgi:acyl-CoA thioester hydrolase